MSTTLSQIQAQSSIKIKRQATLETLSHDVVGKQTSMLNLKQYDIPEEETDFEKLYLVDNSSSDEEDSDENGGGGGTIIGSESSINVKELIDNNLTELLNTMKKFSLPTESQLNEWSVTFGPKKRDKILIFDMDETLIHAEIIEKKLPGPP